jgi:hypothetical protein
MHKHTAIPKHASKKTPPAAAMPAIAPVLSEVDLEAFVGAAGSRWLVTLVAKKVSSAVFVETQLNQRKDVFPVST